MLQYWTVISPDRFFLLLLLLLLLLVTVVVPVIIIMIIIIITIIIMRPVGGSVRIALRLAVCLSRTSLWIEKRKSKKVGENVRRCRCKCGCNFFRVKKPTFEFVVQCGVVVVLAWAYNRRDKRSRIWLLIPTASVARSDASFSNVHLCRYWAVKRGTGFEAGKVNESLVHNNGSLLPANVTL